MRGHVHDVTRTWRKRGKLVRSRQRALRIVRGFDGMNVVVNGAQMIRVALESRTRESQRSPRYPLAVCRPGATGPRDAGSCRTRRNRVAASRSSGNSLRDLPHGVTIVLGSFFQIGIWISRKALCHRLNVGLFAGRSVARQIDGLLHGVVRALETVGIGGIVIVRTNRFGDSPVRHRQFRIEFRSVLKRTRRFVMVEGVNEAQTLIEKLLRFCVVGGNGMVEISQVRSPGLRHASARAWHDLALQPLKQNKQGTEPEPDISSDPPAFFVSTRPQQRSAP